MSMLCPVCGTSYSTEDEVDDCILTHEEEGEIETEDEEDEA